MYSLGFREAALRLYDSLGNMRTVANLLNVGVATIWRWYTLGINTKYPTQRSPKKLNKDVIDVLKQLLTASPFLTLFALKSKVHEAIGVTISRQCLAIAIKRFGFSRKRLCCRGIVNKEVLDERIKSFQNRFAVLDKDSIVAVDESGFDYKTLPLYGYSPKGQKAILRTNSRFRNRINLVMAINAKGKFFAHLVNGTVDGNTFSEFIEDVSSKLGTTILLDNASIHRTHRVQNAFLGNRLRPLFIPPYSPDFNPIENVFSVIKQKVRENLAFNTAKNPIRAIKEVLQSLDTSVFKRCFDRFYKFAEMK